MRTLALLCAALGLATPALAHANPAPPPLVDFTLDNGLRVLLVSRPSAPAVAVEVFYHAGSKDEPEGRRGIAHLFEHMMFKGSTHVPPEAHARYINQLGGENNAYTTDDLTAYVESVPPAALDFTLSLEADRMRGLSVTQSLLDSEREVVKEELRMRFENNPVMTGVQRMMSLAYTKHPYRVMAIGSKETLDSVTVEDCRRFYDTFYRPNNATLVLVGAVTEAEARALVAKHFGPVAKGPAIVRQHIVEPAQTTARSAKLDVRIALPVVLGAYHVPAATDEDLYPLSVLQKILSSGESSRLHRRLVRSGLAVAAGGFLFNFEQPGLFLTYAQLPPGGDVTRAQAAFDEELAKITREKVSAAELKKAKNQLASQDLLERERAMGLADAIGQAALMKNNPRAPFEDLARYDAVTAEQLLAVAKKYLVATNQTTLAVTPPKQGAATAAAPSAPPAAPAKPKVAPAPVAGAAAPPQLKPPRDLAPPKIALDEVIRERLANGLQLLLVPRHDQPLVRARLVVAAGHLDAPLDRMGMADLTAELLRKGTNTRNADQLAEEIDSAGARLDTLVDDERVHLQCLARAADLPLCLTRLGDLMQRPTFPAGEIKKARTELAAAQVQDPKDDPSTLASLHADDLYFGSSDPRGRAISERSIEAITRAELVAFHAQRYRPDGALLIVSGDFDPATLRKLLSQKGGLGSWRSRGPLASTARPLPATQPLKIRLIDKPDATQTAFHLIGPGIAAASEDRLPTEYANYMLGGGDFSSRLMKALRSDGGKTYGVQSALATERDFGTVHLVTLTRISESGHALRLLLDETQRFRKEGPTAGELEETRGNLVGSFARRLETAGDLAQALGRALLNGLPDDYVAKTPARMAAVTLEQVKRAAAAHFSPEAIVAVGPAAQVRPLLEAIGLKVDETVPFDAAVSAPDRSAERHASP